MKTLFSNLVTLRKFDWVVLMLALVLVAIGLSALYSIDLSRGDTLTFFPHSLLPWLSESWFFYCHGFSFVFLSGLG